MNLNEKKRLLLDVIEANEKELQAYAERRVRSSQLATCGTPPENQAREIYCDLWLEVKEKNAACRFDPEKGTPEAWIKGVIQNLVRGRIRDLNRRNKRRACPHRSVSETGAMDLVADASSLGEHLSEDTVLSMHYASEVCRDVRSAAEFLLLLAGDRLAQVLRLRFLEGFSSAEVGRMLGLTANAVNQQVHRAKAYVRKKTSLQAALDAAYYEGPSIAQVDWTSIRR
ncbi:MAG: sigma-70 family RNA polymerase sigma factor [Deltaproteobacteria bacterium]|nr:MAG: sigma-70 family RNA polymerase sigma factor [Deltaproteobacteria bacterium]